METGKYALIWVEESAVQFPNFSVRAENHLGLEESG